MGMLVELNIVGKYSLATRRMDERHDEEEGRVETEEKLHATVALNNNSL